MYNDFIEQTKSIQGVIQVIFLRTYLSRYHYRNKCILIIYHDLYCTVLLTISLLEKENRKERKKGNQNLRTHIAFSFI